MRASLLIPLLISLAAPSILAQDKAVVLNDFEQGVTDWWGNAWGGGKCQAEAAASAKYGAGALHGSYLEVKKGANVVGPMLPEDAPWRKEEWGSISFWLKGDGSHGRLTFRLETAQQGSTGFSASVPLEDADWRRFEFPFHRFWSREHLRADVSRLKRVMFGSSDTHSFDVDQITLHAPHREVPLDPEKASGAAAPSPLTYQFNEYSFGDYEVLCDAKAFAQKEAELRLQITGAGEVFENKVLVSPQAMKTGEVSAPLHVTFKDQGEAKFSFSISSGGKVLAARAGRFVVFPPPVPRARPFVSLLPTPKNVERGAGEFLLPRNATVRFLGLDPDDRARLLDSLSGMCKDHYGVKLSESSSHLATITLARAESSSALPAALLMPDLQKAYDHLRAEAYLLLIAHGEVLVAAKDAHGLFYGLQTFRQVLEQTTTTPAEPKALALTVTDWPTLPVRAASMSIPCDRWGYPNDAYVSPEFFCDFLDRTLVRWKYNTLVLIVGNGMKFDRHPECSGPAAWSKDEVRRVLDFCRRRYIEVIPLQTVLGHATWFTLAHKDLWEDSDSHIACSSNPATQQLLREVYDEILDVFKPRFMHMGMDEAWWKTLDTPEDKRCKLCAGKPKWQIVADQATRFRDYLASKGVRAMMWGDMLLPEHNGGPPYHSAKALEMIPRDIVICNWSTATAAASSKRFRDAGHEVIQSNSMGVNRQQAQWVIGNMMGLWTKHPWLTNSYFRSAQSYSFLSLVQASELSWNTDDDITRETWRLRPDLIADQADSALRQLALRPEPAASAQQRPIPLAPLCNLSTAGAAPPRKESWFGLGPDDHLRNLPEKVTLAGVTFNILPPASPNAIAVFNEPISIPVGDRVASLYFLQGCHLDEKDREAFLMRFRKKEAATGVLLGAYRVRYADGSESARLIRYGLNVLPWRRSEGVLPYCYASPAVLTLATDSLKRRDPSGKDVQLYVVQWVNDRPEKPVVSVEFSSAGTEAVPFLLAISFLQPASDLKKR